MSRGVMISPHLVERMFQRYGKELTIDGLLQIRDLAGRAVGVPDSVDGREKVTVLWEGLAVRLVWFPSSKQIVTFLPPEDPCMRISRYTMRSRPRRGSVRSNERRNRR